MPVERVCISAVSEHRRASKPIMEKRRRARINNSLTELKSLILDATRKDCSRQSKLEKADILEMTVKHLQNVQRQQMAAAVSHDPTVLTKFKGGFTECAAEISRYLNSMEGVDKNVRQRILAHLGQCLNGLHNYLTPLAFGPPSVPPAFFPGHLNSTPPQHLLPHLRNVPMVPVIMQSAAASREHLSLRPQHFFPVTPSPLNLHTLNDTQTCRTSESPCSSPASPFGSSGSSLPPTTPFSPMSTCSKMSEADSVWRPW